MRKPRIMMPMLMLAVLCMQAGCSGKSSPAAPATPQGLTSAPAPSSNAPQGGGVKLDDPDKVSTPQGGGIKNP